MRARKPGHTDRVTVRTVAAKLREESVRSLWLKLLGRSGLYRRLEVLELGLGGPSSGDGRADVADLEVLELRAGDSSQIAELLALNPYSALAAEDDAEDRLARGHRCFLVRAEGRPVASCWVAPGAPVPLAYLGHDVQLAVDEACTFETFTDPATRGRGIGPALRLHVAEQVRAAGASRLLAMVDPGSQPAVRMVEKLGYERIGFAAALRLGRLRRLRLRMRAGRRAPGGS